MNVTNVIHQLLYMVFTAILITIGISVIFGRKPEIHETLALLFLGWVGCFIIAKLILYLGARAEKVIPQTP